MDLLWMLFCETGSSHECAPWWVRATVRDSAGSATNNPLRLQRTRANRHMSLRYGTHRMHKAGDSITKCGERAEEKALGSQAEGESEQESVASWVTDRFFFFFFKTPHCSIVECNWWPSSKHLQVARHLNPKESEESLNILKCSLTVGLFTYSF